MATTNTMTIKYLYETLEEYIKQGKGDTEVYITHNERSYPLKYEWITKNVCGYENEDCNRQFGDEDEFPCGDCEHVEKREDILYLSSEE